MSRSEISARRVARRYAAASLRLKVRESTSQGVSVWAYLGRSRIGHAVAHWTLFTSRTDMECRPEVEELVERYPETLGNQDWGNLLVLAVSHLKEEARGLGFGKELYLAVMREAFRANGPFLFTPTECFMGSGTSPDAKRVWASLARSFPSKGSVVAVLRAP